MTSEIEKEFYEKYEIEKIEPSGNAICCMPNQDCPNCIEKECTKMVYPPITDSIVLGLIKLIIQKQKWFLTKDIIDETKFNWRRFNENLWSEASDDLKGCTLYLFLTMDDKEINEIQNQVQELFGGKNDK